MTIKFNAGMIVPTCSRRSTEELAKEMIRSFILLPLMSEKSSRFIIKDEDFMSLYLKIFIEFELEFANTEVAENISDTIRELMSHLPLIDVKYVTTDIVD